ncbi:MAG TPA: cyclase family protein [Candidatus Angelobacter sp.]
MIYDVSVPILDTMPVWPSDPQVKLTPKPHSSRDKSHIVRVTGIEIGSHTGTHIDAPYHMIEDGRRLNQIPLQTLIGPVVVLEIPGVRSIKSSDLEKFNLSGVQRILFKTDNSQHWNDSKFYEEFVYLEPEAAEFLVERDIKLVGIDYLSIDKFESESHPTRILSCSGVMSSSLRDSI